MSPRENCCFYNLGDILSPATCSMEFDKVELCVTCRGDKISPKLVLHNYKSNSSHEATTHAWIMKYATFSCVCTCCEFVLTTCPRYRSLLHVASVCTSQVFCRGNVSLQHGPSCMTTFKTAGWSAQVMKLDSWQRLIDLGSFLN